MPSRAPLIDRKGWIFLAVLAAFCLAVPVLNLAVPEGSGLHLPTYLVALFGKYLNEYPERSLRTHAQRVRAAKSIPPGWDQWAVPVSHGSSYEGYDYILNDNGSLRRYGKRPSAFLNDVITDKATSFIQTAPDGFFLELSTFNPPLRRSKNWLRSTS